MLSIFTWFNKFRNKKRIVVKKNFRKNFTNALLYLAFIFILHTIAMTQWEKLAFSDSIWLTFTTITTVGYGDIPIKSLEARLATIILLYLGGIFVLAKTAGDYFDYRTMKYHKQLRGEWRWNMNNHIVIISDHDDHIPERYYEKLVAEFRQVPQYESHEIQILTQDFKEGLPESLQILGMTHYNGKGNVPENLEAVDIAQATIIIILAKQHHDPLSDGNTFDILHRVRDLNQAAFILVECVDDVNRSRLQRAGANIMIRPIRAYPEMIVSALCAPGSELVMENMFTSQGDTYQRFEVTIQDTQWADIVYQLIKANIGTTVAYISDDNKIYCNPNGSSKINAKALIVIVRENKKPTTKDIEAALLFKNPNATTS